MRQQMTLAMWSGLERYRKARRTFFWEMMNPVAPRRVTGVGRRTWNKRYGVRKWFNLSDPVVQEALHDSPACAIC